MLQNTKRKGGTSMAVTLANHPLFVSILSGALGSEVFLFATGWIYTFLCIYIHTSALHRVYIIYTGFKKILLYTKRLRKKNGFKRPLPPPFPLPLVAKSLWDLRGLNISHGHEKEESESLNTKRQNRCKSCVIRTRRSLCHGFFWWFFGGIDVVFLC